MKPDIQGILEPFDKQIFFDQYLESRSLIIKRNNEQYFSDFLNLESIHKLVKEAVALNSPDMKLIRPGGKINFSEYRTYNRVQNIEISISIDYEKVLSFFEQKNAGISLQNKAALFIGGQSLSRAVSTELHCNSGFSITITPPSFPGFASRYEAHDIFILQLQGKKRWKIFESGFPFPLRMQKNNPVSADSLKVLYDAELDSGDTLYVPRGMVFEEGSSGEISAYFRLDIHLTTYTRLFLDLIRELGEEESLFRRDYFFDHLRKASSAKVPLENIIHLIETKFNIRQMDAVFEKDAVKGAHAGKKELASL